jgi:kinesin family protein C1
MLKEKEHTYSFDTILGPDSTQHDVFDEVNGVVQSALDGYDVCLFSYGQTGSGKTHTMTGNVNSEEHKGIIPRSVDLIFDKTMELSSQGWNFDIAVSCCQIYQEKIFDLLNQNSDSNKNDLKIVNDQANKKIIVTDLQIKPVKTVIDVHQLLATAAGNRKVAQTSMNAQSSRSHFVFTLHVTMINTRTNEKRIGNLNLCDLAGSERVSSAKTTGEQFKETQKIKLSLSTLNRVFLELAADKDHIPFRESKLTDLLQYCLSGNGKTMMIVNLSPTAASAQETSGSLQLARTVSMIQSGKHKGSVSKNGSTGVKGPVVRKAQVQIQQHHVSQQEHSDMVDHDTPCMSAQTIVNGGVGIKSGPDGNKRQRLLTVQSIKISTGDEDIDNELASLSEYAELPALFDPDHGMASLMPGKVIIDELTQLVGKVKMEYDSLMLFLGEMTTRLSTIQTLLPDINMDTVYNNVFNENQLTIDTAPMYIQQQIDIFVPKFDHFKEKLATLKHSIQTSTLELSRKGQTLQFNSLKLELNSQEEKIEMLLLTLRAQSLSTNHSAEGIFNSYNILMTILSQFEQQEELFKQELDTMTNNLMSELDELSIEFNNALNCEYEDIMKQLQDNQTQFRNTYSTKYLAEIRALEKTGKLFEEVKSQHDELKQQYELLDGQVKGLDFLKEFNKNPTITPNDYIIDQRTFLQTKKDELVQLEQQCTSYDDELLNTRKTKLNKYRHHNQQLEVKIASLGGQNALMQLLTNPNGKEKKNNIHTQPQIVSNQDSILNNNNNNNTSMADDELTNKKTSLISQSIKPSSTTTTTTTTTAATAATHTKVSSQPIVSTKPKPLTATAPRTGNVATVPRSVPVSRSIPPTSSAVTKPLTTGTPNGSLSRVTTMAPRAGVKK